MAIVISRSGIPAAIVIQAVVILAVCLLVILARERAGERLFPWSRGAAQEHVQHQQFGLRLTLRNLRLAMSTRTTFTLIFVALTAFLCEGLYDPLTTEFFIQKLGWGAETYATNQGTLGVTGELIGALSGGFFASRYGGKPMALIGLGLVMATMLMFSLLAAGWDNPNYSHVMLLPMFRGSVAFTTVSLFSLYMKSCWTAAAATQFTLYMALNNIGYSIGTKLNSWLPAFGISLDYPDYYVLGGLLPAFAFLVLLTVPRADAARAPIEESLASPA